jgi:hypothetical protein
MGFAAAESDRAVDPHPAANTAMAKAIVIAVLGAVLNIEAIMPLRPTDLDLI